MRARGIVASCVLGVVVSFTLFSALFAYVQRDPVLAPPMFAYVEQHEGESVAIDIGASLRKSEIHHFNLYTKTLDSQGEVVRQTPVVVFDPTDSYKIITYSKLPIGEYKINVNVEYQLNPITTRTQEFTVVLLTVKPKE